MELKKGEKLAAGVIASLAGLGFTPIVISGAMVAYDAMFPRFERPDYTLFPGAFCYDRMKNLPREEFFFPSGKYKLKAYYYPVRRAKGLVVFAHGLHAGADDYLPMIEYMVKNRYAVFAFNYKGTYESEGDGTVGMCESLVDLDAALEYISKTEPYASLPLFLIGHSWGGYAVTSILSIRKNVKACAAIAPMNNGNTMILEKGEQYAGELGKFPQPLFNAYHKLLFGKYVKYSGHEGVSSVNIPVVIAQGIDDKVITINGQSVMAHKDEITNPNVIYYVGKGYQGEHNGIMHSNEALAYRAVIKSEIKLLEIEKGRKLTEDERREYYKTIDHTLYSAVNEELFALIVKTFDNA